MIEIFVVENIMNDNFNESYRVLTNSGSLDMVVLDHEN